MANPNNITLRSEKGSFLTFEEMDLNLVELQNLIIEVDHFVNTTYSNFVSDQINANDTFDQFIIDQNDFNSNIIQDVDDIEITVNNQNARLDQVEFDISNLQAGTTYAQVDQGVWDSGSTYDVNDVVTYNGITYISVVPDNTQEPPGGNWISYTSASIADQVFYDNTLSSLDADDVQSAIDELDQNFSDLNNKSLDEFQMAKYEIQASDFTASENSWYSLDVSSSAMIITLPPSPSNGDTIVFLMNVGDVETNNITVNRNGETIEDLAENMSVTSNYPRQFKMRYNGTTWRVFI